MDSSRRRFLSQAVLTSVAAPALGDTYAFSDEAVATAQSLSAGSPYRERYRPISTEQLEQIALASVLKLDGLESAVRLASIEVLQKDSEYIIRVRDTEGTEGIGVGSSNRLVDLYPMLINRIAPYFKGKDARQLESLLLDLYREDSNYKYQGLALWASLAVVELAILDLLGKVAGKPLGELFAPVIRKDIEVYRASSHRGNAPEQEVEYLGAILKETGGKAVKFRLGGRMSQNKDYPPGRTEALIRMARETLGPGITLYGDANSSYDVENGIRIGKLMEEYQYAFLEEPCPFDDIWGTKKVRDTVAIPIAGGEQEFSQRRFIWAIANQGLDVIQPDIHYHGGMIRSLKIARMAEAANLPCTPHMSGAGLGFVYVLHFAAISKDPGPYQEYKGQSKLPFQCSTSSLLPNQGSIKVPTGPGLGVEIDPGYLDSATVLARFS